MSEYVLLTDEQMKERATKMAARFGLLQELQFEDQWNDWIADHDRRVSEKVYEETHDAFCEESYTRCRRNHGNPYEVTDNG